MNTEDTRAVLAVGIIRDHVLAEKLHSDIPKLSEMWWDMEDKEKLFVMRTLAKEGLLHPVDGRKRKPMGAYDVVKSARAAYEKRKLDAKLDAMPQTVWGLMAKQREGTSQDVSVVEDDG